MLQSLKLSSTPEKYQQFLHVGPRPMTLQNSHFAKQIKKILERFPFVRTGWSVRPFCKWYASVLRTGSGRSGQTGPPLIVGPSSSHAPAGGNAGSARNIFFFWRVSCCSRCTTDVLKAFFSLRKMAATTSQACGRDICRFLTFSPTVHKTHFV